MSFYADFLRSMNIQVEYVHAQDKLADVRNLIPYLKSQGTDIIESVLRKLSRR